MSTHLSRHFAERRLTRGLKPGQLARLAGCANVQKNGGRIRAFELSGRIGRELFERVARALEIDRATIERLVEQDRREFFEEWLAWVNVPIQPYLVIRLIPAVYSKRAVPSRITSLDEAEAWASSVAVECRRRCCLVWSRKLSSWFDEIGELSMRTEAAPDEPNTPWMMLKGKGQPFLLDDNLRSPASAGWPGRRGVEAGSGDPPG
jgi:hypothetical protein